MMIPNLLEVTLQLPCTHIILITGQQTELMNMRVIMDRGRDNLCNSICGRQSAGFLFFDL